MSAISGSSSTISILSFSISLPYDRYRETEGVALLLGCGVEDAPVMALHDLLADGEPQPGAAGLAALRAVQLLEFLEQLVPVAPLDHLAAVGHRDRDVVPLPLGAHHDHLPNRREFDRVGEQVGDHLDQ